MGSVERDHLDGVCALIAAAANLRRMADGTLASAATSTRYLTILRALERSDSATVADLARVCGVTTVAVTATMRTLRREGLVAQAGAPAASQGLTFVLTGRGRLLLDEAAALLAKMARGLGTTQTALCGDAFVRSALGELTSTDANRPHGN